MQTFTPPKKIGTSGRLFGLCLSAIVASMCVIGKTPAQESPDSASNKNAGSRMSRQKAGSGEAGEPRKGMAATMMRAKRDFGHIDADDDKRISAEEWMRRGNFELLDTDGDGYLTFEEMAAMYRPKPRIGKIGSSIRQGEPQELDASFHSDLVPASTLSGNNLCGIDRESCKNGQTIAPYLGLTPTGLGPRFPIGAECFGIDDTYALNYAYKRSNASVAHGGFDIPAPWDTPVLTIAAGTIVGRFLGTDTQRGVEVIIRHSPEDTGLPFWTYTQYAHLAALPPQALGQRVRMGEVIGMTSNTGLDSHNQTSDHRRPALHFVAWFSSDRRFVNTGGAIVPVDGQWMDPHTLYRGKPPFESAKAAELPDKEKWVDIPVMYVSGKTEPHDTRMIWPYTCIRRR